MLFFRIIRHLLPTGRAWRIVVEKVLRWFFEGLALGVPVAAKEALDDVHDDLRPATTRALPEWLDQFGLVPGSTEDTQRQQLTAAWLANGGQSPRYIQDTLQAAGFAVYVHQWWVPGSDPLEVRDPRDYTAAPLIGSIQCGDSPEGICGDTDALCDEFVVNPDDVSYLVNKDLTLRPQPPIPSTEAHWRHFMYIGGETFGTDAVIDPDRRTELERLILKIRPTHAWIVLLVSGGAVSLTFSIDAETGPDALVTFPETVEHDAVGAQPLGIAFSTTNGIVCGDDGWILRSIDGGDTWATLHDGDHADLGTLRACGVASNGSGTLVIVADDPLQPTKMLRSTDGGATWAAATDALDAGVSGIANISDIEPANVLHGSIASSAYGGGLFVAIVHDRVADRLLSLVSSNGGASWSAFEAFTSFASAIFRRVGYCNGAFYVVAFDDANADFSVLRSADGETWVKTLLGTGSSSPYSVVFAGGTDILIVGDASPGFLTIRSTDDGATWGTPSSDTGINAARFVERLGSRLFAITADSSGPSAQVSDDGGATWAAIDATVADTIDASGVSGTRVFYGDEGGSGMRVVAIDPLTTYPAIVGVRTATAFNASGIGLAAGVETSTGRGFLARSTTDRVWVDEYLDTLISGLDEPLYGVAINGSAAVGVGVDTSDGSLLAIYSADAGATWARTASDLSALGIDPPGGFSPGVLVTYGAGLFVAAGCDASALFNSAVSADNGVTWTPFADPLSLGAGVAIYRLRFLNGAFYALVGASDTSAAWVFRSVDGENWTSHSVPLEGANGAALDIAYIDGIFVAAGLDNADTTPEAMRWTSADGLTWTRSDVTGYTSGMFPFSLAVMSDLLIAGSLGLGGPDDSIHTSADNGVAWTPIADDIELGDGFVFDLTYANARIRGSRSSYLFSSD